MAGQDVPKHQCPLPQTWLQADAARKPSPCWLGGLSTVRAGSPTNFGIFESSKSPALMAEQAHGPCPAPIWGGDQCLRCDKPGQSARQP